MRQGFTLIELMIVIAIIAIIASIAIPSLMESKVTANEAAAAASMKAAIFPSQTSYQAAGHNDSDANGTGEFGHLQHLAGKKASLNAAIGDIKLLTGPMSNIAINATFATANGYKFLVVTPDADGSGNVAEGGTLATITEAAAENNYVVLSAPNKYNESGRKVYLMTEDGQVRAPTAQAVTTTWFGADNKSTVALMLGAMIAGDAFNGADISDLVSATAYIIKGG